MNDLHLVLTCTNRKRQSVSPALRLRDVPGSDERLAAAWVERVAEAPPTAEAQHLYAGDYWSVGSRLRDLTVTRFGAQAWVLSAGYGLIRADDKIAAYGATLSPQHPDSVATRVGGSRSEACARWWRWLSEWAGPGGPERTLAMIAETAPGSTILVCAGRNYLEAIASDLRETSATLTHSDQLLIVASGDPIDGLSRSWVKVPAELRMALGGGMGSIGVRAGMAIVDAVDEGDRPSAPAARVAVENLARSAPALPDHSGRARMSDEAVLEWIADHILGSPAATRSTALRALRDAGFACEQRRFGTLFLRAEGGV